MCSQTSSRLATARVKLSAYTASVAALIAPAEVPQTIGKGLCCGLPRRSRTAEQDRADGHAAAGGGLQQVERDVGGVERRQYEEIRLPLQLRAREHAQANLLRKRGVAVHLAVDLELGRALADQRERLLHL